MANYTALQENQLKVFQDNIRKIRSVLGWSGSDLAEVIGVTRQTINNLETGKSQLTFVQYVALCAVIEKIQRNSPELRSIITAVLKNFPRSSFDGSADDLHLLDEWFSLFPNKFVPAHPNVDALKSIDLMEVLAREYKIFLSPDLLFLDEVRESIESLGATAQQYGNALIVPFLALQTIIRQQGNTVHSVTLWINEMQHEGRIRLYGQENDPPLTEMLISQFIRLKKKYKLCLITRNEDMAMDILALNNLRSFTGLPIRAATISTTGAFIEIGQTNSVYETTLEIDDSQIIHNDLEVFSKDTESMVAQEKSSSIEDWATL